MEPVETQLGNQQFQILAILSESNKDKLVAKFGDIMLEEVTTFQQ